MRMFILLALCCAAVAEEKTPKPPTITPEHQAEYWRTQLVVAQAQTALKAAQQDAQEAFSVLVKDCPGMDPGQDQKNPKILACVPKPEPSKK